VYKRQAKHSSNRFYEVKGVITLTGLEKKSSRWKQKIRGGNQNVLRRKIKNFAVKTKKFFDEVIERLGIIRRDIQNVIRRGKM